jgi:hypothetical protein
MPNFWADSGYSLLEINSNQHLLVTDDFLRSYLKRPELAPIPESCPKEVEIFERLLKNPREVITASEIGLMKDKDVQENYLIWLRFRDKLLKASSLESFYLELFQGDGVDVPPLFIAGLTQIFLRHILGADTDPLTARMAELLFRTQKISILEDGAVMAADNEIIERHAQSGGFGSIGDLLRKNNAPLRSIDLDVLIAENMGTYWDRDDAHDMVIQLNHSDENLKRFSAILEKWIRHFLGIDVTITPQTAINDDQWIWHVGLDASATEILNALYEGEIVDDEKLRQILSLFRLEFKNPSHTLSAIAGKPIYLGLAIDAHGLLKVKPQNLLVNLPLAKSS